jgi:hypothetical protein
MKTNSTSVLALVTVVSALALAPYSAASAGADPFGVAISQVACGRNAEVTRGATKMTVLRLLGAGYRALSRDVWVYPNHHADSRTANARECDSLVLTFADGKVTDLKVVNHRGVALIAASLPTRPAMQVAWE